jgi:hypothetical protein
MPNEIEQHENPRRLTWSELVELEPRLENLLCQVEASRPIEGESDFDYEGCWGHFKDPNTDLVGWHRRHGDERLRTTPAYEIVYRTLWQALHD